MHKIKTDVQKKKFLMPKKLKWNKITTEDIFYGFLSSPKLSFLYKQGDTAHTVKNQEKNVNFPRNPPLNPQTKRFMKQSPTLNFSFPIWLTFNSASALDYARSSCPAFLSPFINFINSFFPFILSFKISLKYQRKETPNATHQLVLSFRNKRRGQYFLGLKFIRGRISCYFYCLKNNLSNETKSVARCL